MAGTSIHSVYRRTARAAAQQRIVKKTSNIDVERARKDFAYFCDVVGDKPPAEHHKEWHKYLCTGEDSECLIGIGGPNIDILAPRGSAKSFRARSTSILEVFLTMRCCAAARAVLRYTL